MSKLLVDEASESRSEIKRQSVLERIRKSASALQVEKNLEVELADPKVVKSEYNRLLKDHPTPIKKNEQINRGGRPKIDPQLKAKDVRVTIRADLYELIEKQKLKFGESRSKALCDLLAQGREYQQMRALQGRKIKAMLREFNSMLSQIKIRNIGESWKKSTIELEDNERTLGLLFNKSLEIKSFLQIAEIDMIDFAGLEGHLSTKEMRQLKFACNPAKMGSLVDFHERAKLQ